MFHHNYTVYIWGIYTGRSLPPERFNLSSVITVVLAFGVHTMSRKEDDPLPVKVVAAPGGVVATVVS